LLKNKPKEKSLLGNFCFVSGLVQDVRTFFMQNREVFYIPEFEIVGSQLINMQKKAWPISIDPAAVPTVNGTQVDETYELRDGDELEFVKPSGTKG